jgi:hypothetical protein
MEFTGRSDPTAIYTIVRPIFFNDNVIGVLDGRYVQGTIGRRALRAFRVEQRTSFKHPVVGAVLGGVLTVVPLLTLVGDPLGLWWLTLASPLRLVGSFFMLFFGVCLLWGVMRRREQPWLVLTTASGERAFPLNEELPETAVAALRSLVVEAPYASDNAGPAGGK